MGAVSQVDFPHRRILCDFVWSSADQNAALSQYGDLFREAEDQFHVMFHDENGNGRLDTLLGVPREGFAFSRNPPLRLGPPEFDEASVTIADRDVEAPVRLRYLL